MRGTNMENHNIGHTQHLQNIRFHVNNVFDADCADPIGPATSTTTSHALHLQLGQTDTLRWRAEVHRPLGAAAQLIQTERPFKIPSATCRGLLEGYRCLKYSRAAAAD